MDAIVVRGIKTGELKEGINQLGSRSRLRLHCTSQEGVVIAFARRYRTEAISENIYLMYINAGEPPPATLALPWYLVGVPMKGFKGGRASYSAIFANTKWGRYSWPFP